MLIGSQNTVEQIAELCGFNSASHFTRAFRGATGITPSEFRRLQF
ncbi:MAG: AraC family transcriptional regulator [Butyricicoccus sp.]|nr:AraC family transcriptional regulator [Butyricicoccus sp.]